MLFISSANLATKSNMRNSKRGVSIFNFQKPNDFDNRKLKNLFALSSLLFALALWCDLCSYVEVKLNSINYD